MMNFLKKKRGLIFDFSIFIFPATVLIFAAAFFLYEAWWISWALEIKGADMVTEVSIRSARAFFFIYIIAAAISTIFAVALLLGRHVYKGERDIISRLNWTVERFAEFENHFIDKSKIESNRCQENHWPWGTHHTAALGDLEAAAHRFWALYDSNDPSTAPTNEMVAGWLRAERGTSKEKAAAIASILRADGLRPGPRR